jgi:hypothetical protein
MTRCDFVARGAAAHATANIVTRFAVRCFALAFRIRTAGCVVTSRLWSSYGSCLVLSVTTYS